MSDAIKIGEVAGFATGAVYCGVKSAEANREDVGVIVCEASGTPMAVGAVFTTNKMCAAPVKLSRRNLAASRGLCRAIVVNAGNANCATGEQGEADAREMVERVAGKLDAPIEQVLVASTGVIGRLLPMDKVRSGIDQAIDRARSGGEGDFATAILTTDLVTKTASRRGELGGKGAGFTIAGACKGSGMIGPNMATMLAFLATDVKIEPARLQRIVSAINEETFNRVTVDGDTSTNDSVFVAASGAGDAEVTDATESAFARELDEVMRALAMKIARDGEGATHFVTLEVAGAAGPEDAAKVGRTVAESLLVKTAVAGNDPNWGRILAAVGRSGARVDAATFSLTMNGLELYTRGTPQPEPAPQLAAERLGQTDILIHIDLGQGDAATTFYTCDLTHGYITINADYHT